MGKPFLVNNSLTIDYFGEEQIPTQFQVIRDVVRTETLVPIITNRQEGTALLIHS